MCNGFDGLLARNPDPGDGCGNIDGEGLMLGGKDGGEAKLKEDVVAGLDPKLWCWGACRQTFHVQHHS